MELSMWTSFSEYYKQAPTSIPVLMPPNSSNEFFYMGWCFWGRFWSDNGTEWWWWNSTSYSICKLSYKWSRNKVSYKRWQQLVWNHFEVYLLGHKITIFTDHQALVTGYILILHNLEGCCWDGTLRLCNLCLFLPSNTNQERLVRLWMLFHVHLS